MHVYLKKLIKYTMQTSEVFKSPLFPLVNVYLKGGKTVSTVSSKPPVLRTWGFFNSYVADC